jgi:hypothetical protein
MRCDLVFFFNAFLLSISNLFYTNVFARTLRLGCCLAQSDASGTDGGTGHVDAHAVLDVVTARVGLNEYFTRWEEMRRTAEFAAAAAAPVLAKPLTRVTAQRLAKSDAEQQQQQQQQRGGGGGGGSSGRDLSLAYNRPRV